MDQIQIIKRGNTLIIYVSEFYSRKKMDGGGGYRDLHIFFCLAVYGYVYTLLRCDIRASS